MGRTGRSRRTSDMEFSKNKKNAVFPFKERGVGNEHKVELVRKWGDSGRSLRRKKDMIEAYCMKSIFKQK